MAISFVSRISESISISSILAFFTLIWFIYSLISSVRGYRRLSHIPGPHLAAWTNLWWINAAVSRKGHLYLHDAITKYGPLIRIGPNVLATCDTDLIRKINAVRSSYHKSDWYKGFRFDADRENLFSETNKERHHKMRQKVTLGYSGKDNPNFEPDMDKVILTMIDLIKSRYISHRDLLRPMDLGQILQYLTLDIITALSLGRPFGWLEDDDKYAYIATMQANIPAMNFLSVVPFLSRLLRVPAIQRAVLPSVNDKIGMGKIKAVAHEAIAERFQSSVEKTPASQRRNDMTQSFIEHGLTQAEIADESLLQILAGSDTSGTIMRAAFIYITTNPRIYSRLKAEIASASADIPPNHVVSHAQAQGLPYLNACIRETMRYYPVNTGLGPKTVGAPEGDVHNGVHIPFGTDIGIVAWDVYRYNPVYGIDAATYRPERWLEADAETLAKMEREHELVFMYGRYKCLGERLAWVEIRKAMFELFRRFDFAVLDPLRPLTREDNYGLWLQKGLMVRVEETPSSATYH